MDQSLVLISAPPKVSADKIQARVLRARTQLLQNRQSHAPVMDSPILPRTQAHVQKLSRFVFSLIGVCGVFLSLVFFSSAAKATEEEVPFEEIVKRLNSKTQRSNTPKTSSSLDEIQVHMGFGFINSLSQVQIKNSTSTRPHYGFEITLGIDLFSNHWMALTSLRNFSPNQSGTETRSLKETDVKVLYKDRMDSFGYRLGMGLGTRELRINDENQDLKIHENTPIAVGLVGFTQHLNSNFGISVDFQIRPSLLSRSTDQLSMDASLGLITSF